MIEVAEAWWDNDHYTLGSVERRYKYKLPTAPEIYGAQAAAADARLSFHEALSRPSGDEPEAVRRAHDAALAARRLGEHLREAHAAAIAMDLPGCVQALECARRHEGLQPGPTPFSDTAVYMLLTRWRRVTPAEEPR